ncbi:MAG TPA: site-specific integrase [Candidatus Saccharimonadales bacterium]|nr:site-specific integrase [Candidatus Saccharimonadales bacterium]
MTANPRPKLARRRRDRGDGAIFQRADGRWVARLRDSAGRTRYLYAKDRAHAKQRLAEAQAVVHVGQPLPDQRLTFGRYLLDWVAGLGAGVKPRTVAYYETYVRRHLLTSDLAQTPLARLEPSDLRRLYTMKLSSGLSSTSVHHIHAVIHVALQRAVDDGVLGRNVAALVGRSNRPKVRHIEMNTIAEGDQPRRFLEAAKGERLEALLILALTTGMRRGELLALRWKDVNLDRSVLAVTGSLQGQSRSTLSIATPKSGKSRSVALGTVAVTALREHRKSQAQEQLLVGGEWRNLGLVFATGFGDLLSPTTLRLALRRTLTRANLPTIRFHDLRHSAATIMLSRDVHPKMASEMLGHSTIAITLDLYSHVTANMQRQAADAIDAALADPLTP